MAWTFTSDSCGYMLYKDGKPQDVGLDLWTVFNRLQENLVRGGLHGRSANARRITTRPIVGIDSNLALNRALWALAESFLKGGV